MDDVPYTASPKNRTVQIIESLTNIAYKDLSNFGNIQKVEKLSSSLLSRIMQQDDYETLMLLLFKATQILTAHNVPILLTYGTMLGSVMMQDLLPWDDDIDLLAQMKHRDLILDIFTGDGIQGIKAYDHSIHECKAVKLYFNSSQKAGKYNWGWPYIEICF